MDIAKVFWSGRSQAVRLPKAFRFDSTEVRIRREGNRVILEPVADDLSWLDGPERTLDEDFVRAALDRPKQPQDRPELDKLWK